MNNILTRIQDIASNEGITIGALERKIGASKGVLSRAINNGTDIQSKWIQIIVENYPQYSTRWLMTGKCPMLRNTENSVSFNPQQGTPYYDVDFIGGFDIVFNDQTIHPTLNIVSNICPRAEMWCNITGHSMEPTISHGDIIALRKCNIEDIQYGEMYAVVLDSIRTVKILRKSNTPGMLKFVPINISEYDEQEFSISRILHVYEVVGSIRRFF